MPIKVFLGELINRLRKKKEEFKSGLQLFFKQTKKVKRDKKLTFRIFKNVVHHFTYNTALHGYRCIALPYTTLAERIGWTVIVAGALMTALALVFLSKNYEDMKDPTITLTDSTYNPVYNYLYPGITICNLNKISKKKAAEMADDLAMDPKDIPQIMVDLTSLTDLFFADYSPEEDEVFNRLEELFDNCNTTAYEVLLKITPTCDDLLIRCLWKGREYRCNALFQSTYTPEGVCCSFNHYAFRNMTFKGYNAERYKMKPKKMASCGPFTGLDVTVEINIDDYLVSELSAYGIKLLVHDTYDYQEWNSETILVPPLTFTGVNIVPYRTYSTPDTRRLSPENRGCYFIDESWLPTFANYSYQNCINECRKRIMNKACNCTPFYYINSDLSTPDEFPVCSINNTACLASIKTKYLSSVPGFDEENLKGQTSHIWGEEKGACTTCLPNCEYRDYLIRSTSSKLNIDILKLKVGRTGNFSGLKIFYRNLFGYLDKTDTYNRWHATLGLFGGLLGLCIGFTLTGAFDVIYYFTLRLLFDMHSGAKVLPKPNKVENKKHQQLKTTILCANKLAKIKKPKSKKSKAEFLNKIKMKTRNTKRILSSNLTNMFDRMEPRNFRINISPFTGLKKKPEYFPYLE